MFLLTAFHQNCVSLHFQKVDSPLEFLGLYKTKHSASSWNNIPANLLSGNDYDDNDDDGDADDDDDGDGDDEDDDDADFLVDDGDDDE